MVPRPVASVAFCCSRCTPTRGSMSKRKAPEQSVPTPTSRGAPPSARSTRPASAVAAARSGGGNEALRAAWEEFGQPELYEAPDAQELSDLSDSRNRLRGTRVRGERGGGRLGAI